MNDTEIETRIRRLKYRANHRGIKEMDIILGNYANDMLDSLDENDLDAFEALMQENDNELWTWFSGAADFPIEELQPVFEKVRAHFAVKQENA